MGRRVYAIVRAVPEGRVTTYGDVAKRLTRTISRRGVASPPARTTCRQRVVRADGSLAVDADGRGRQRRLLEREGVHFDDAGRVRLKSHRQKVDEP
ncbi:MAG: MGMT family protein [Polyangiales bacterium]